MFRFPIVLLAMLVLPLGSVVAQSEPVEIHEVYDLARERNPMLRASHAAAEAVAAQQPSARLPPDPELQLGVMNASLPGLQTNMPGAMLPSVQAMQLIPFPGKLRLSGEIARQSTASARLDADETWWEVRSRAAMAFYEIYQADRQIAVMEQTLDWLNQFEQVAMTMYSVGSGRQSDVLRAGVEVARMNAEIARMRAMRATAVARLNAVMDRPGDTPVPAVSFGALPADLPSPDQLQLWAEETRPALARGRVGLDQAGTREALARRQLWPDLSVGLQYGQRPSEMGTERMGSIMLGFSLPVFAGQRQMQMRSEASAMREMASADLNAMRAEVRARIGELVAELDRARTLLVLYRTEVLPQAEANVISAFASYRVGRVDFLTLVDAQMTLNQYQQELFALYAEYGRFISELESTVGRALPATTATLGEDA